jgi:hypothetical protein
MNKKIKEQMIYVLEDDNEVMRAALEPGSDLDDENKQMNRELIEKHEAIIDKVEKDEPLTQLDLQLIRDANEIHLNDEDDLNGRHKQAVKLEEWLDMMTEFTKREAMKILEDYLDSNPNTPVKVYRALHTIWEESTPDAREAEPVIDDKDRCQRCGSKVSFADVTDTLVFVGDEIVKRYDGDITNRNCVRCNYPEQYPEYEEYDKG